MMRLSLLVLVMSMRLFAVPDVASVAVVYNSADSESKDLAEYYVRARKIPVGNLIGLELPKVADISRVDYEKKLVAPLRKVFDERKYWKREVGAKTDGLLAPVENRIRVVVLMKGVPLRIAGTPVAVGADGKPVPVDPINGHDEASVDSELAMFGVEGLPSKGVLANKYYERKETIEEAKVPFMVLTARIDSAKYATCRRMIQDAIEVEKGGLWGMAYVDVANKFPQGDQWLEQVVRLNRVMGIPTVVDRQGATFAKNFPMTEAAMYYGWYDWNVSGPFLNPAFRFRKGAVAMHLHSFSAEQLVDGNRNWSAGLLERGAAVTIGNVYEPYLHLTHHFDMIHDRLLGGYSWVEACWMAMPACSWQAVVLGDPLYAPFRHLDGGGERVKADTDFRALRAAVIKWPTDEVERRAQLEKAGVRMSSGVYQEAAALNCVELGLKDEALRRFEAAKILYANKADQLRQDLQVVAIHRDAGRKEKAIELLKAMVARYAGMVELETVKAWLAVLEPVVTPAEQNSKK